MDMAQLMQLLMSMNNNSNNSDSDNSDSSPNQNNDENSAEADGANAGDNQSTDDSDNGDSEENNSDNNGFGGFFDNINLEMLAKISELFSRMNKPDMNAELLLALRPHLRDENRHKIDNAVKMSRMMSMLPYLKESGILNDLF